MSAKALVSIVVPLFNESASLAPFCQRLRAVIKGLPEFEFELLFVNDGSTDDTLERLKTLADSDPSIRVVDLSRNFGKESALTAGLDSALGDAVIPMDVDLQDPPELIPVLIERWQEGFEVVLAKRSNRKSDSFFKRRTADLFYRVHNSIAEAELPRNVGDFRLMDAAVVEALRRLPERRRFMKGLFAWVGFKTTLVEYVRETRVAGKSKFSGWKLWNFALEGITSFSTVPLRFWTYLGLSIASAAFVYALFIVFRTLMQGIDVPGYASLLTVVLFLGGIQLIGIGVIGEYVGRIYMEAKQRPIYVVREHYRGKRGGA